MQKEKTKEMGEKGKSKGFSGAPLGRGMCEMMKKCCAGRGGFPDCSDGMEGMTEAMTKKRCCMPNEDADVSEGRKK
jgi:hypothetical protein